MSLRNLIDSTSQGFSIKMENLAPQSSYTFNGLFAAWGALTFNEAMMLIGAAIGLATFFVNFYFQKRRDRREQELHRKRMESNNTPEPPQDSG